MSFQLATQKYVPTISGFQLTYLTARTISVGPGQCFDSTQDVYIDASDVDVTTVSLDVNGLNGLDTGSVAINTYYNIFVIFDATSYNPIGYLASTSRTAPLLPPGLNQTSGYTSFKRIGTVRTDGSSNILKFVQSKVGNATRLMQYDAPIVVLTAGASTTYAAVSLAGAVPGTASTELFGRVTLNTVFTPAAASDTANLKTTGATADWFTIVGQVTAVVLRGQAQILPAIASSVPSIDYKVSAGTLTLAVTAYEDVL